MKTKWLIDPDGKVHVVNAVVDKHGLNGYQYHVNVRTSRRDVAFRYKTFAEALNHYMKLDGRERRSAYVTKVTMYDIDIKEEKK